MKTRATTRTMTTTDPRAEAPAETTTQEIPLAEEAATDQAPILI